MKRLIVAAALMVATAAIVISGMLFIDYGCHTTVKALEKAREAMEYSGEYASDCAAAAEREWEAAERVLRLFVNAGELNEIGLTVAELPELALAEDSAEFYSQLRRALVQLRHLSNEESIE